MQKDSRFFDDIARLAGSAAGTFGDMKRELEGMVRDKVDKMLAQTHLARREEFEVVRLMAEEARLAQAKLEARIEALEKRLAEKAED
jgi:BMFP domain-containing protein YqiC